MLTDAVAVNRKWWKALSFSVPVSAVACASSCGLGSAERHGAGMERQCSSVPSKIRQQARDDDDAAPDEWWQYIAAVLGMPEELAGEPLQRRPWATWSVALLVTAASGFAFLNLQPIVERFGLIPAQFGRYGGLTLLTSFFLHAGALHLLGNMYFFLVFGDNVEDFLGKLRFLALLVLSGLAGNALHIIGDPRSLTPCIGASGAISGVIAFYALKFPHARMGYLFRVYMIWRWVRFPAFVMFLFWVGLQVLGAIAQVSGFGSVSSLAHLGGAATGVLFWLATRNR
jgi:membrane associated rhomboid family serine protease